VNAPNEDFLPPKPPPPPKRRSAGLAITSLVVALALLPAPLAVLYDLNDECRRATSWTQWGAWRTLWEVPPVPVAKSTYLLARGSVIVAMTAALVLLAAAIATVRSRPWSLRLHAAYVPLQLVATLALIWSAHRFSQALDATATRDWVMHLPVRSTVRSTAILVGAPALLYPLALVIAYAWQNRRRTRGRVASG
jgi:hypothetical protein